MAGSFFVLDGNGPTLTSTFEELVQAAIQSAGAIGPKSVTIANPTGSDQLTLFYVNAEVTVQQITCAVKGVSPSIHVDLYCALSPSASGTSLVAGGLTVTGETITTSFDNATIPANRYVCLATSSKSGTVDELSISIDF